jgi:AraC-like DNA-binding protein
VYSKSAILIAIFLINFSFLIYLIGPMFYWYIRGVLTDNPRLNKKDLWHLLPALIFLVTSMEYTLFTPFSYKLEIGEKAAANSEFLLTFEPTFLIRFFSNSALSLSRSIFAIFYITWSLFLLIQFLRKRNNLFVLSRQRYMIPWLFHLISLFLVLTVSHLLTLAHSYYTLHADLFYTLNVLQVLSGIGLIGLLVSPFFFPGILYGLPRLPVPRDFKGDRGEINIPSHTVLSRKIPVYESEYHDQIVKQIDDCMAREKPYLHPGCNIFMISMMTRIPSHHLAYHFREERKTSFNQYRNKMRIDHAKSLISEGKASELTLEAIGKMSGFSNRNTFITAFKKAEGISPGEYLKRFSS